MIDDPQHARRRHALAEAGETFHVTKENRHLSPLARARQVIRPINDALDYAGIDIAAKGLPDACLGSQFFHHGIEAHGEFPNLVTRSYRHLGIEGTLLDTHGSLEKSTERPDKSRCNDHCHCGA